MAGGYDFFSQPQGPQIDISLFGDAALQGAQLGKATPTKLTSALEGITEGVKTGLDLYGKYEQNQLLGAQVENEQAIAQINKMKAEAAAASQQNEILTQKAKAENELKTAQTQNTDLKNIDKITQDLGSTDPNIRASVITNPDYTGTLIRNKDLAGDTLSRISNDPELDPTTRQKALGLLDYTRQQELRLKQEQIDATNKKQSQSEFGNISKEIAKDASFQEMLQSTGLTTKPNDISQLEIISKNFVDIGADGKAVINRNKDVTGFADDKGYVAVKNGQIVENVYIPTKKTADNLSLLKSSYQAYGLLPQNTPKPSPSAAASPSAAPSKPFLERFSNFFGGGEQPQSQTTPSGPTPNATPQPVPTPAQSINGDLSNNIVSERSKDLVSKASANASLRDKLVAKGILRSEAVAPRTTGTPTPSNLAPTTQTETPMALPKPIPTPKELIKKINYTVSTLSPEVKSTVKPDVVSNVLNEPLLRDLDPIYQAVAAVESSGLRGQKGKGSSATGFFQLTDAAESDMKVDADNPKQNVDGGVAFLNLQLKNFKGAEVPALFAYNLGPAVADAAFRLGASADYTDMVNSLKYLKSQGRFPKILGREDFEKNLKYPLKVLAYKEAFQGMTYA